MLLVDGHNLIGRTSGLSLTREQDSRELVLRRIAAVKGSGGERVIIVFDGNRPGFAKERSFGGVRVVYAPAGHSADDEIMRRVTKGHPPSITVITSDRQLADRARQQGARSEDCEAFWERLGKRRRATCAPAEEPSVSPGEVDEWLEQFRAGQGERGGGHNI